jgi:hypothetical protein
MYSSPGSRPRSAGAWSAGGSVSAAAPDDSFAFGLQALLDGLEARLTAR